MNSMNRVFLLILLFINASNSRAQLTYEEYRDQHDLNIKSEMGIELWNYFIRHNLDSLKIAAVDLLLDAADKKHDFARAVGARMLGSFLYRSGKLDQGLDYLTIAKTYFEKKEDYLIASEICNEIGHVYFLKGDFKSAKKYYNASLKYGVQSPDETAAFNGKLGLGKAYIALGDTNTGMTIIHSYKQLSLQNQKYEAASDAFSYMAMIESMRKFDDLSAEYYIRSVNYSKLSKSKIHLSHSYANMGILKFGMKDYDSSLYYFQESLDLRLELKAIRPTIEAYYNLASYYWELDSIPSAIRYFNQGLELAKRHKFTVDEVDILTGLIEIYGDLNDQLKVERLSARKAELEEQMKQKLGLDDEIIAGIDLDFMSKSPQKKKEGGLSWVAFTIIVVAIALVVFIVLERKRTR